MKSARGKDCAKNRDYRLKNDKMFNSPEGLPGLCFRGVSQKPYWQRVSAVLK